MVPVSRIDWLGFIIVEGQPDLLQIIKALSFSSGIPSRLDRWQIHTLLGLRVASATRALQELSGHAPPKVVAAVLPQLC